MLLRRTRSGLRLVRQCDHALVAGRLAAEWIGPGPEPEPFPFRFVLAVALHDLPWATADREPRWNAAAREPFAFDTVDDDYREPLYRNGLDALETVDDYAALLASRHFGRFLPDRTGFSRGEIARRERIAARLSPPVDERALERHRAWLGFFDFLSLFCLLTGPDAVAAAGWLDPRSVGTLPEGDPVTLEWVTPGTLR
ncbi:MAG TPA: DUF3891 family protein, partial [bacterium]|nr:DUF3891 family protein [bacterium]